MVRAWRLNENPSVSTSCNRALDVQKERRSRPAQTKVPALKGLSYESGPVLRGTYTPPTRCDAPK